MRVSFEYNRSFWPPMPVIEFTVEGGKQAQTVTGLIDSGADATAIPVAILDKIGARNVDERWARDLSSLSYPVNIYRVRLTIGDETFPSIEVIGNQLTSEIVIGRDVLNQFIVTLNGLAFTVEVSD